MKNMTHMVWAIIGVITVSWFLAEPQLFFSNRLFYWRSAIIQYSGAISFALMSLAMLLALRISVVERWTHGLDKSYRLHKWLGIAGVATGIVHWLWFQVPKWLVMAGMISKPLRHTGSGSKGNLEGWGLWSHELRDIALALGEWGFYLLLILSVVSLWGIVKYKPFKWSHRLMAVVYLMIAIHAVLLVKQQYIGQMIQYVTLVFAVIGSGAALYSLFGLVGASNRYQALVQSRQFLPRTRILDLTLMPEQRWPSHKPGQFAYLSFAGEEPHPFTIASGSHEPTIRFLIKELGDFTTGLHQRIGNGEEVCIEGPYGRLAFDLTKPQIWVAGGVGIASYYSALLALKGRFSKQPIYLFYSSKGIDVPLENELKDLARQARVILTIINTEVSTRLNAQQIKLHCGDLSAYEFYFCGPVSFSQALRKELKQNQVDTQRRYHEELFVVR